MNKKGFTLVELLAVIVILAIIALIATPIIMNVVNNARLEAAKRSVEGYAKALESSYYIQLMSGQDVDIKNVTADYSGARVTCNGDNGEGITIKDNKIELKGCTVSGYDSSKKFDYKDGKATEQAAAAAAAA